MRVFTIGEAWSLAVDFFVRNRTMLLVVAGGLAAIGVAAQILLVGDTTALEQSMAREMERGNWKAVVGLYQGLAPTIAFATIVAGLFQTTGQFAALRMGLSDEKNPNTAVVYGVMAAFIYMLFLFFAIMVFTVLIGGVIALLVSLTGGSGAGAALIALLVIALFIAMILLFVRIWVAVPAMASVRSVNPIFGITQSWALTRDAQWALLGYAILLGLGWFLSGMVFMVFQLAFIAIAGPVIGGVISSIIYTVPVTVAFISISAGIFRALLPAPSMDVFA